MQKIGTKTIETERLILRRFRVEDAAEMYHNWASDPAVTKYLTWKVHANVEVTAALLSDWVQQYADGGYFNWAIELKETGRVIGNISVVRLNEAADAAEIGYCMTRALWGRGIMPEALRAVMVYLFDEAQMNRIMAAHDVNNPKSGRVMQKAGMQFEGVMRQAARNNCGLCDLAVYAALKSDGVPKEP